MRGSLIATEATLLALFGFTFAWPAARVGISIRQTANNTVDQRNYHPLQDGQLNASTPAVAAPFSGETPQTVTEPFTIPPPAGTAPPAIPPPALPSTPPPNTAVVSNPGNFSFQLTSLTSTQAIWLIVDSVSTNVNNAQVTTTQ